MFATDSVWERQGPATLSKQLYATLICSFTAIGILVSAVGATISSDWELNWVLMIGVLLCGFAGVWISAKSDNPAVSFAGYMLVALPYGLLLGPLVSAYTDASVIRIFFLTASVVVTLGIIGAIVPASLEHWGVWLFGGLMLLLGGMILMPLLGMMGVPVAGALTLLDWVGLILFAGYVLFDLNRAMRVPYTLDNSIDVAVSIYLDFFNIFIRLLSLFGERDD